MAMGLHSAVDERGRGVVSEAEVLLLLLPLLLLLLLLWSVWMVDMLAVLRCGAVVAVAAVVVVVAVAVAVAVVVVVVVVVVVAGVAAVVGVAVAVAAAAAAAAVGGVVVPTDLRFLVTASGSGEPVRSGGLAAAATALASRPPRTVRLPARCCWRRIFLSTARSSASARRLRVDREMNGLSTSCGLGAR